MQKRTASALLRRPLTCFQSRVSGSGFSVQGLGLIVIMTGHSMAHRDFARLHSVLFAFGTSRILLGESPGTCPL